MDGGRGDCGVGVPTSERLWCSASSHSSSTRQISRSSKHTSASSLREKNKQIHAISFFKTRQDTSTTREVDVKRNNREHHVHVYLPLGTSGAGWLTMLHLSCHYPVVLLARVHRRHRRRRRRCVVTPMLKTSTTCYTRRDLLRRTGHCTPKRYARDCIKHHACFPSAAHSLHTRYIWSGACAVIAIFDKDLHSDRYSIVTLISIHNDYLQTVTFQAEVCAFARFECTNLSLQLPLNSRFFLAVIQRWSKDVLNTNVSCC